MVKDTLLGYGSVTRFLHISMAVLIISLLIVGFLLGNKLIPQDMQNTVRMIHKSTGLVVILMAIVRILWRRRQLTPSLDHIGAWQKKAAQLNIKFLYICMVIFPLTGLGMSLWGGHPILVYNLFTIPALVEKNSYLAGYLYKTHCLFGYLLMGSLTLHIGAALYHHFILKDNVLRRMFCKILP